MTMLYLIRHAETYFNVWHKVQGWCDSPLTPRGIEQAKSVRRYFEEDHIKFASAYSSTSERACDTLELITHHKMNYKRLKDLREWGFGSFEGQDERLNPKVPYEDFFVQYGGESQRQLQERIFSCIDKIMKGADLEDKVLIVSHAGAIYNFLKMIAVDVDKVRQVGYGNCGILKI
ncbi:histidine phosphatase family protein [uncultured Lactobacillus sp.]|uniref:histidine phosphatase family protein n=1 Tax=uncultured Lactobacillus sp. TaxID=153152 RepID=UPI002611CA32|nr:histidine phosphatase family protein [uncultured Lactobacillus sp.]